MSLLYIWRLALQYRPLLVLGLLVGLLGGWGVSTLPATYEATSSILVRPRGDADLRLYTSTPERFARSQARIAGSDLVLDLAVQELGDNRSRDRLRDGVRVGGGTADDVIAVIVEGSSDEEVETTAAAVVEGYQSVTRAGTEILGTSVTEDRVTLARTLPLGAGLGLLAALLAVLLLGAVRAPALTPAQLAQALPHRVFPLPLSVRRDRASEAGRLRLVLQYLVDDTGAGAIVVAGLDDTRLELRLAKALREVAAPHDRLSVRALSERRDQEEAGEAVPPVQAVLCCVRTGTPTGRVQEHLASLEVFPGSRLVVMGV